MCWHQYTPIAAAYGPPGPLCISGTATLKALNVARVIRLQLECQKDCGKGMPIQCIGEAPQRDYLQWYQAARNVAERLSVSSGS